MFAARVRPGNGQNERSQARGSAVYRVGRSPYRDNALRRSYPNSGTERCSKTRTVRVLLK